MFVLSSLPVTVVDGSKSFSYPCCSLIVSSTTPGAVSLVHGFTHDKSILYLFSTRQARSQQLSEILIHLLKKRAAANNQSVVPNDAPRDLGPEVAFGAKFQIPVARQGEREMSATRPYVTEPFRPLGWISKWEQFLYITQHSSYFFHVVRSSLSCGGAYLTIAHALLQKHSYIWFRAIISLVFFHMVRAGVYWHKIPDIHACVFAVKTKRVRYFVWISLLAALVKTL